MYKDDLLFYVSFNFGILGVKEILLRKFRKPQKYNHWLFIYDFGYFDICLSLKYFTFNSCM